MSVTQGTITVGTGYRKSGSDELIRNATATKNLTQASASQTVNYKNDIYVTADDFGIVSEGTTPTGSLASGLKISTACYLSPKKDYILGATPTGVNFSLVEGRGSAAYTVVGSPTITDGVASGFSTSNYLTFNSHAQSSVNSFELIVHFNSGTITQSSTVYHRIFAPTDWGADGVLYLQIPGNTKMLQFGNYHDGAYNQVDVETLSDNTDYWYKIAYSSSDNVLRNYKSTDSGLTWSEVSSQSNYSPMKLAETTIGIGASSEGTSVVFGGSIYLYDMSIKINGSSWFEPYPVTNLVKNTIGWAYDSTVPSTYDLTSQVTKGVTDLFQGQTKAVTNNLYLMNKDQAPSIPSGLETFTVVIGGNVDFTPLQKNGRYYVRYSKSVYMSEDYKTWTLVRATPSNSANNWFQMGDRFFCHIRGNDFVYSDDEFANNTACVVTSSETFGTLQSKYPNYYASNGNNGIIHDSSNRILYTHDKGVTWTGYTYPNHIESVFYFKGYFYMSAKEGSFSGKVVRSAENDLVNWSDTGLTFTTRYSSDNNKNCAFAINENEELICMYPTSSGSGQYRGLKKTSDGLTWTEISAPLIYSNIERGFRYYKNCIFIAEESRDWFYVSADGGNTWTEIPGNRYFDLFRMDDYTIRGFIIVNYSIANTAYLAFTPGSFTSGFIASASGTPPTGFYNYSNTGKIVTLNNDLTDIVSLT